MSTNTFAASLRARVEKGPGCWEWLGAKNQQGYGRTYLPHERRYVFAHRLSAFLSGKLHPGLCVLHRCDNPACVRPSHLFTGTRGENNTDRHEKGRTFNDPGVRASASARRARPTCQRGHPRTAENTYTNKRGHRECRICRYEAVQRWRGRSA